MYINYTTSEGGVQLEIVSGEISKLRDFAFPFFQTDSQKYSLSALRAWL